MSNVVSLEHWIAYKKVQQDLDSNKSFVYDSLVKEFKILIGPILRNLLRSKDLTHYKTELLILSLALLYADSLMKSTFKTRSIG